MAKEQLDQETQQLLSDGEELEAMCKSRGWAIAKQRLTGYLTSIGNILDIKGAKPEDVMIELAARQVSIQTVLNWVKEIEGSVAQHQSHREVMQRLQHDHYVLQLDSETR